MKYSILCLLTCFCLCTACFEKEEINKEEEKVDALPSDFDVMKCERIQKFVTRDPEGTPKSPPATLKKYLKGNEYIFETDKGGSVDSGDITVIAYWNTDCEFLCNVARGGTAVTSPPCEQSFLDSLIYIETVWVDER